MTGRIIIVSNRLPLSVTERRGKLSADRSIGGLATALSSVFSHYEPLWIGWTGVRRVLKPVELQSLSLPESIVPVQAPAEMIERYYDRFATRVLWPTLHATNAGIEPTDRDWAGFEAMTARFAKAIQEVLRPDDIIWVHDSHLMLLPQQLRALGIENRLGFFLHTPFPPPERFLGLSHGRELLASLCEADVLGLQTGRDVDAFWATLREARLMGQPGLVRAFPIGVDYALYHQAAERQDVQKQLARLRKEAKGRRVVLSISRLDHTKGILQQLLAVEQFMLQVSNKRDYVYKLVVAPSRESVPEYRDLKRAIAKEVRRINKKFGSHGWQPVEYLYENIGFSLVAAHYLVADVLLLTPPIDGMNLVAKEYAAVRQDDSGMLVLSDSIGAAFQLQTAVLVDAYNTAEIADGLMQADRMTAAEKKRRWQGLRASVCDQDVFWWAEHFLQTLEKPL